jgi:quinol monooxygenase YgiN
MYALLVEFQLVPDKTAEFDALTRDLVAEVKETEPRTLVYLPLRAGEASERRVFFEVYESREAFEIHEHGAHTTRYLARRRECLVGPPTVTELVLAEVGAVLRSG